MTAVNAPHLPEDIVVDILLRLPVKSVLRFRSVSKFWCDLLRTEAFIVKHHRYQIASSKVNILVKHGGGEREECFSVLSSKVRNGGGADDEMLCVVERIFSISIKGFEGTLKIRGPVNGLLCVSDYWDKMLAIWNPATREFKTLPISPTICGENYDNIGFGFDSKTNDYKIIRFVFGSSELSRVELYSLKSDSWREITPPSVDLRMSVACFEPYKDGVYYWSPVRDGYKFGPFLLFFDFGDEVFKELAVPSLGDSWYSYRNSLAIFNKQLSLMLSRIVKGKILIDIWVMTERGDEASWEIHVTVGPLEGHLVHPLGFWKNSLFLEIVLERSQGELVLYDMSTRQLVNLQLHGVVRSLLVSHYVESLVPINDRHRVESEPFIRNSMQN